MRCYWFFTVIQSEFFCIFIYFPSFSFGICSN
uniref:Uncharacterized protein n=1 Tax=Rhizophora mucronata TaxID=61149 RepID=A0A2P2MTW7_RHIMU